MYHVVFRTVIECETTGAVTRTCFTSKAVFDEWYDGRMRSWYEVMEEGVSDERALELCTSDEANHAILDSYVHLIGGIIKRN